MKRLFKKYLVTLILLLFLVMSMLGTMFVKTSTANYMPMINGPEKSPPSDVIAPKILNFSLQNNTVLYTNNTFLNFTIKISNYYKYHPNIYNLTCKADWMQNNITFYYNPLLNLPINETPSIGQIIYSDEDESVSYPCFINLQDLPIGNHSIQIYVTEKGDIFQPSSVPGTNSVMYPFKISNSATFVFKVVNPQSSDKLSGNPAVTPVLNSEQVFTISGAAVAAIIIACVASMLYQNKRKNKN